jgi:hypothetical protein
VPRTVQFQLSELEPVLGNPTDLHTIDADAFDLVFYPGGRGPMEDLAYDGISGNSPRRWCRTPKKNAHR